MNLFPNKVTLNDPENSKSFMHILESHNLSTNCTLIHHYLTLGSVHTPSTLGCFCPYGKAMGKDILSLRRPKCLPSSRE